MIEWSKEYTRSYLVHYHGYNTFDSKEDTISSVFDRLHTIQIDPLNICGRNHELVLQSRIKGFSPASLYEQLYDKKTLIEGWEKQASMYPVEDWPLFQRRRKGFREYIQKDERGKAVYKILPEIKKELEEKGPLPSTQIEYDAVLDWRWAPAKAARAALEALFDMGEVIIVGREHNRKIYDLTERVLPSSILNAPDPNTTDEEYNDLRVQRRIESTGLLWDKAGSGWLDTCNSMERKASLLRLSEKGSIVPVKIQDIPHTCYVPVSAQEFAGINPDEESVSFLAPLDNMMWDRELIKAVFGFDYVWEVYKPANQRKYGHYVLPMLAGNRFIGRVEPVFHKKADKKRGIAAGTLEIRNWWWEDRIHKDNYGIVLKQTVHNFTRFLNAKETAG